VLYNIDKCLKIKILKYKKYMRELLFIVFFGIFLLVACNNPKKLKESNSEENTEQLQEPTDDIGESAEEAIDDSGEIAQDSTEEADPE